MDVLTKAIVRLYDNERFYAELLLQMNRIISDKIPTLGVCVKDVVHLYVNPEFFASLPEKEQVAVLKHECQHIFNDHISRGKEYAPEVYTKVQDQIDSAINEVKHKLMNIAMDCSINPGISNIPEDGMFPKLFDLPDGELMEWYVENLKNNEKLKGVTHFDDHSLWAESEGDKAELKEKIKKTVNAAADKTRAAGKMTNEQEVLVNKLNHIAKDWKSDLKRFAARAQETVLISSRKKRNRRYGIMYPGSVKEETLHVGVAIDTSGSVSDEALSQFMAEIGNIAKYAIVTVAEADSEVKNIYAYDSKKTYKVKGRGGTAYQPALDYFTDKTEIDGLIYFGDMDNYDAEVLKKPKYPVLWAIIGGQAPPAKWGSVTKVEVKLK